MCESRLNILNLTRVELGSHIASLGFNPDRSDNVFKWIHQRLETSYHSMDDISKELRSALDKTTFFVLPKIQKESFASDGVIKWLLDVGNNNYIETVFIPERDRATLCVSSQVGCMLNCSFCSTATQGFNRNLTTAEIIAQLWLAQKRLKELRGINSTLVTNIVFMGMGEPLLNTESVFPAVKIMRDDFAYGLSSRRVTISTSGVVPNILKMDKELGATLAVSLHAPNDALRNILVPINRKYPLNVLLDACGKFLQDKSRREKVTIEYVMLDGVNDSLKHAEDLVCLLNTLPVKINLIPFNSFGGTIYKCSSDVAIQKFVSFIRSKGLVVTVRRSRGDKISAACGQLVGDVLDRTKRKQRFINNIVKNKSDAGVAIVGRH